MGTTQKSSISEHFLYLFQPPRAPWTVYGVKGRRRGVQKPLREYLGHGLGTLWAALLITFRPQSDKKAIPGCLWTGSGARLENHIKKGRIPEAFQPSRSSSLCSDSSVFTIPAETQNHPKMTPKIIKKRTMGDRSKPRCLEIGPAAGRETTDACSGHCCYILSTARQATFHEVPGLGFKLLRAGHQCQARVAQQITCQDTQA